MAAGLKVTAPATLSNINCGFDILGAATEILADEIVGRRTRTSGVVITEITGQGKHVLSRNPAENTAGVALLHFLDFLKITNSGIEITIHKQIPPGSGLGSSAASACAALVLANALFDNPLSPHELLPLAVLGEYAACNAFHADNVAPCLLGGITLVRDTWHLDVRRLNVPDGLCLTVVLPQLQILTSASRGVLRQEVSLRAMVKQSAHLGALVLALERSDLALLASAMVDAIITPQRKHLIPGFDAASEAAFNVGVIGCGISGSGPALFAFSHNTIVAEEAGIAMQKALSEHQVTAQWMISKIGRNGASLQ